MASWEASSQVITTNEVFYIVIDMVSTETHIRFRRFDLLPLPNDGPGPGNDLPTIETVLDPGMCAA
jgi:hypothetical protein